MKTCEPRFNWSAVLCECRGWTILRGTTQTKSWWCMPGYCLSTRNCWRSATQPNNDLFVVVSVVLQGCVENWSLKSRNASGVDTLILLVSYKEDSLYKCFHCIVDWCCIVCTETATEFLL